MHATLPIKLMDDVVEKRIEDMVEGEFGTCAPYAMASDAENCLWLDPGALVMIGKRESGFVVSKNKEGYVVSVNAARVNYRWKRNEIDNSQYDRRTLPVLNIYVHEDLFQED